MIYSQVVRVFTTSTIIVFTLFIKFIFADSFSRKNSVKKGRLLSIQKMMRFNKSKILIFWVFQVVLNIFSKYFFFITASHNYDQINCSCPEFWEYQFELLIFFHFFFFFFGWNWGWFEFWIKLFPLQDWHGGFLFSLIVYYKKKMPSKFSMQFPHLLIIFFYFPKILFLLFIFQVFFFFPFKKSFHFWRFSLSMILTLFFFQNHSNRPLIHWEFCDKPQEIDWTNHLGHWSLLNSSF